jgi:hypothetical protein
MHIFCGLTLTEKFQKKMGKSSSFFHIGDKSGPEIHFSKICTTYKEGGNELSKVQCEYIAKMPFCL